MIEEVEDRVNEDVCPHDRRAYRQANDLGGWVNRSDGLIIAHEVA